MKLRPADVGKVYEALAAVSCSPHEGGRAFTAENEASKLLFVMFYFEAQLRTRTAMVTVPVATCGRFRHSPPRMITTPNRNPSFYGEKVRIIELQGDWVRVEAIEQQNFPIIMYGKVTRWMLKSALVPTDKFPNQILWCRKSVQLLGSPDISKPLHRLPSALVWPGQAFEKHFRKSSHHPANLPDKRRRYFSLEVISVRNSYAR